MAVRSLIYNRAKVGVQAALGTGVAVSRVLNGFGFSRPRPVQRGGEVFTSEGEQFPSVGVPSMKGHTELSVQGKLTFNTTAFVFGSLFGNVSVAADGTNGKKRDYVLGNATTITPSYLTVEIGDASRAKKVIDAFGRSLTITLTDAEQSFSMGFLAGARQDDTTPTTAGLTEYVPSIVNPAKFDVYVADTYAGLATAEATGSAARFPLPLMTEIVIPDLISLLYRMNSSDTSFTATPAIRGVPTLKFKCGDDDADFALFLPLIASGATKFFRIVALGSTIAGATPSQERMAIDFAGKLIAAEEPDEQDGAATNTFTFQGVHDPTSAKVINLQTINDVAAYTTP